MDRRVRAALVLASLAAATATAETTRTLRVELANPAAAFAVENLAGVMTVRTGDVAGVVAVATIHAENEKLADSVTFTEVAGDEGLPTLLVRYPVREHRRFRYPADGNRGLFGWDGSSQLEYDGRRVKVGGTGGVLLWAEVEVTVPGTALDGTFKNHVGRLEAAGLRGRVRLDTASGNVTARDLDGDVELDTGSGDILAERLRGDLECDTGSGDCIVTAFDGAVLKCDTGSGDVRVEGATAQRIEADTGSGDVRVLGADTVDFRGDTGSGSVTFEAVGDRLARVVADTGSGDVMLRLPADASFACHADQGSGDLVSRFPDARAIVRGRTVVGYERGDGRIRIDADTGSGDVTIAPRR